MSYKNIVLSLVFVSCGSLVIGVGAVDSDSSTQLSENSSLVGVCPVKLLSLSPTRSCIKGAKSREAEKIAFTKWVNTQSSTRKLPFSGYKIKHESLCRNTTIISGNVVVSRLKK